MDYFAETSCCGDDPLLTTSSSSSGGTQSSSSASEGKTHASSSGGSSSGQTRSGEVVGAGALASGPINVTPNPMDSAVCTQPRATIVVQQVRSFVPYVFLFSVHVCSVSFVFFASQTTVLIQIPLNFGRSSTTRTVDLATSSCMRKVIFEKSAFLLKVETVPRFRNSQSRSGFRKIVYFCSRSTPAQGRIDR